MLSGKAEAWDKISRKHSPIDIGGSIIWARREIKRFMNRRGNPNWGRPVLIGPAVATEFDLQVRQLRLMPENYVRSEELRRWCLRNKHRCYVPEWLLDAWGISVDPGFSHVA